MPLLRIYLDTSVVGGCLDDEFQEASVALFNEFKAQKKTALISQVLVAEIENAPLTVQNLLKQLQQCNFEFVELNQEIESLARKYIENKTLPEHSLNDARHIASATYCKADVLVSWNFEHIVNYRRIHLINAVNLINGYWNIDIRNPREVLDYEN